MKTESRTIQFGDHNVYAFAKDVRSDLVMLRDNAKRDRVILYMALVWSVIATILAVL